MRLSLACIFTLTLPPLATLLTSAQAHATTEPAAIYDARSVAMGGAGVAFIHNGASLYHNPAALQGVDRLAVTAAFSPAVPVLLSPINGPHTQTTSSSSVAPLFLLGGAYRVADRVVLGLAVYPTAGFGASYNKVAAYGGQDAKFTAFGGEAVPGVSFAILDNLAIGLGYRITYVKETSHQPLPPNPAAPPGPPAFADTSLSGTNFAGAEAGLFYQPMHALRLGASYRSKVTASLSGTTTIATMNLNTTADLAASPHSFKIGGAYSLLQDTLLLALDLKYLLFSESSKTLSSTTTLPGGQHQTITTELDWKNSFGLSLGAEYKVAPEVPLRVGYSLATSATPDATATYFTPAPGLVHGLHAGAGWLLDPWELGLGGYYAFGGKDVTPNQPFNPGFYGLHYYQLSASVTYHL